MNVSRPSEMPVNWDKAIHIKSKRGEPLEAARIYGWDAFRVRTRYSNGKGIIMALSEIDLKNRVLRK